MAVTIKDIASKANVSIATVSRYLNNPEAVSYTHLDVYKRQTYYRITYWAPLAGVFIMCIRSTGCKARKRRFEKL